MCLLNKEKCYELRNVRWYGISMDVSGWYYFCHSRMANMSAHRLSGSVRNINSDSLCQYYPSLFHCIWPVENKAIIQNLPRNTTLRESKAIKKAAQMSGFLWNWWSWREFKIKHNKLFILIFYKNNIK